MIFEVQNKFTITYRLSYIEEIIKFKKGFGIICIFGIVYVYTYSYNLFYHFQVSGLWTNQFLLDLVP